MDHGIRGGEPACERLSGLAAFAHLRAELRAHRRELARQRLVGQGFAQRRPGTVQLDQAIDRNALLLEQAVRSGDQDRGPRKGFAPRDRRLPARLRRAIQPLILIPKFARRLLECILPGERRERGKLQLDARDLVCQLQQRAVVSFCRMEPFPPALQLGFGNRRRRCWQGRRVLLE